jgi:TrmH family RNA methyltransferase
MSQRSSITSRHNPRYRAALALREGAGRRDQGRLLVDGDREIARALDAGVRVVEAWVAGEHLTEEGARVLVLRLTQAGADVVETTSDLLGRLAYGERDGIVAVVETPATDLGRLVLPEAPLLIVVEGVEKPGNLGALLRSADGAGVDGVVVVDPVSDVWNPNAIRASLGTVLSLPLAVCTAPEALEWLRESGVRIVAARVDAPVDYDTVDMTGPVAIAVGAETTGLSDAWSAPAVTAVRIPMLGVADSLNVSASAAVLLYEARRQRRAADRAGGPPPTAPS